MVDLLHRVRVFVFQLRGGEPNYLLLKGAPEHESFWTPIHGPIGFGEKLESAIRREVLTDTGLTRPAELIDLQMPHRWIVGDEEVIEWTFGFRALPTEEGLTIDGDRWTDFRWWRFGEAYPSLELDPDRAAITRLHAIISSN